MIVNNKNNVPSTVVKFYNSSLNFYLTGSRFFDTESPDSDWNFFIQFDDYCTITFPQTVEKLEAWLVNNGFEDSKITNSDSQTIAIYIHKTEKVSVQIVQDAILKNIAQEILTINPSRVSKHNYMHNDITSQWEEAYQLAEKIKKFVLLNNS